MILVPDISALEYLKIIPILLNLLKTCNKTSAPYIGSSSNETG